jgi:hypothetical protein
MIFGQVPNPKDIHFELPPDHPYTARILQIGKGEKPMEIFVRYAKWNKTDLKNYYPKGTKDELTYYSTQFNSIELNATFKIPPRKNKYLLEKAKPQMGLNSSRK